MLFFYFRGFSNLKIFENNILATLMHPNSNKKANSATKSDSILLEFEKEERVCNLNDIFLCSQQRYLGFKSLSKKKLKKAPLIFLHCLTK